MSAQRHDYHVAFETLGDVVAMLLIAPWTVPDFDPEADLDGLLAFEEAFSAADGIVVSEGRYLLEARRSA